MDLRKRTWAEISLDNIEHNYRQIRGILPEKCKFLGVVKADAYGHGAVEVSRRLESIGADYLAVSCLDEAVELRQAGIRMPILILGHTPREYVGELIGYDLTQTVTCEAKAIEYSQEAAALGKTLRIHIKVDTGMSRLGFLTAGEHFEQGIENIVSACRQRNLDPEGVYTHFAVSDEPGEEARRYTLGQFDLFMRVIAAVESAGISFRLRHCANSGAVAGYPETALDMVRPGILLYGFGDGGRLGLRPCMRLMTHVSTIKYIDAGLPVSYGGTYVTPRRTRMGVIPIGYADGLLRTLPNNCSFMTERGPAPQRGRICMDMCMIDLTDLPEVNLESLIEIFGQRQTAEELAHRAGTISYELLCSVSKRVPRVYVEAPAQK